MCDVALIYPYFMPRGDKSLFRFPPLGLGYIASYLILHGINVKIIDGTFQTEREVIDQVRLMKAHIIGIQCILGTEKASLRLAKALKLDNNLLIAGGPQASVVPSMFLDQFDLVVIGEGEQTMLEIIDAFNKKESYHSISGVAFKEHDQAIYTSPRKAIANLDSLPFPARNLYTNEIYKSMSKMRYGYSITSMIATRGCPFDCDYCSRAVSGNDYHERSVGNVVDEIEQILGYGYDRIWIADDAFTFKKDYVISICNEIIKRELRFGWECLSRVDTFDEEMAEIMKQAGCMRIFFGIESGSDDILQIMKKHITVKEATKAIDTAKKSGIRVGAFFIIGYPGENDDTILQTIKYSNSLPIDHLSYTFPYPMPGTGLYEKVRDRLLAKYWNADANSVAKHELMFKTDFSESKLKFALFKGLTQFKMRKCGFKYIRLPYKVFEIATDIAFRMMR